MAGSTLMSLLVKLGLDSKEFTDGIDGAEKKTQGLGSTLASIGKGAALAGIAAIGAGITAVGAGLVSSVQAAMEAENIQAQLGAVLKSTGGAAGVTADMVNGLAESLSGVTKFEDDAIVSGESMLLTFTNIGKDVFPQATQTMLDMSQAMGMDLNGAAIMLGKALNDPAQGLSALTRMGVTFTSEQENLVKSLMATGKTAEAQAVILQELQKEFGGSAEAAGKTFAGKLEILKNKLGNVKETIGGALLPILTQFATWVSNFVSSPQFQEWVNQVTIAVTNLAQQAAVWLPQIAAWFAGAFQWLMENQGVIVGILAAIGVAIAAFVYTTVIPALVAFIVAAAPVIAVMAAVGLAAYLLYQAWTTNFGGIRDKAAEVWANLQPVFAQIQAWLAANIPLAIAALVGFWNGTLLPALTNAWSWIQANLIPLFAAVAELIGTVVVIAVTALYGIWQNVLLPAFEDAAPVIEGVAKWFGDSLGPAIDGVSKAIQGVIGWIKDLITSLKNIKLPAWMTPGSPTPWQIGLEGVTGAMRQLSRTALPQLQARLDMGTPSGVSAVTGGNEGGNVTNNYNIFTKENPGQVKNALTLSALMGGAA